MPPIYASFIHRAKNSHSWIKRLAKLYQDKLHIFPHQQSDAQDALKK